MLGAIVNVIAVLDALITWGLGWRYILSSRFRSEVHAEWRNGSTRLKGNLVFSILLFVLLNGALLLFSTYTALWLYRGIVVPRLTS